MRAVRALRNVALTTLQRRGYYTTAECIAARGEFAQLLKRRKRS